MWHFMKWARAATAARPTATRRPALKRLMLEELETRQVMSVSPLSISSTVNANFQPVTFSIAPTDHSLWEYNLDFNPAGTNHWKQISTDAFAAVSAVPADYAAGAGNNIEREPAAYAIRESDRTLWLYNPALNPASANEADHWVEVSPGAFDSISAAVSGDPGNADANIPRTLHPVVYGVVATDHSLWENDPAFNPGAAANSQWAQISPGAFLSISATDKRMARTESVNASGPVGEQFKQVVFGIVATDHTIWEHDPDYNANGATANDHWQQVSPAPFLSISATHHTAPEYPLAEYGAIADTASVYGILEADHSLWENDIAINPSATNLNECWYEVSNGSFAQISATTSVSIYPYPTMASGPAVVGVLDNGTVWENNPAYAPAATAAGQWKEISAGGIDAVTAVNPGFGTGATFVFGVSNTDAAVHSYTDSIGPMGQLWGQLPDYLAAA